jgi:NADH-quinone oxidoreductase subunit N
MGLSHSGTLLMLLTSWTLVSATSYALIALLKDKFSASGATKYGLMSLASSMLLLLSLAFISTQDKNLAITQLAGGKLEAFLAALVFSSAALGFKAGIFPFHAWLPDTYGVSDPYPISIVAAISKSAVILAFYKLSIIIGPSIASQWLILIGALSVLTMTYANITALLQKGFQGLLAYSSIAHAGYILVGIAALTTPTAKAPAMYGLLMQLTTYTFAKTGLFLLAKLVRQTGTPPIRLEQLNGLSKADSTLAASALILVLSLMGIPPLVGFWGKFFLFLSVVGPATWLTATALINTGIAAAYYARVIKAMYFEPGTPKISGDRGLRTAIISSSVITLVAGLVPLFFPPP